MDIAVIGAGISGLVAAYLLRAHHRVTVFEANDYLGGHTHTIPITHDGQNLHIDTGFIVFNEDNYLHFTRLLRHLGVESQSAPMSFSVRCDRTGLEYNGTSLNTLFAHRTNLLRPRFLAMLRDILRFHREAPAMLRHPNDTTSVAQWLATRSYTDQFATHYLEPLGASLWSCASGTFRQFPMQFVIEFLAHHGMLRVSNRPQWRVIRGGSFRYVEKLAGALGASCHLSTPVRQITRHADGVQIATAQGAQRYDEVILACHADQALGLLGDATTIERDVLAAFPYQSNAVTLHTDDSVLPRCRRARAAWNARLHKERDRFTVTYNMNILQSLDTQRTYCVTLNHDDGIDKAKVLGRWTYHHPIFTARRRAAQDRHSDLIRVNRSSFCGAYWGSGFHEDGVKSALAVCRAFGHEFTA